MQKPLQPYLWTRRSFFYTSLLLLFLAVLLLLLFVLLHLVISHSFFNQACKQTNGKTGTNKRTNNENKKKLNKTAAAKYQTSSIAKSKVFSIVSHFHNSVSILFIHFDTGIVCMYTYISCAHCQWHHIASWRKKKWRERVLRSRTYE